MSSDLVVYLHTNLCLICRHWAKRRVVEGKDKDVGLFPDDMGLDNSVELAMSSFMLVTKLVLVV